MSTTTHAGTVHTIFGFSEPVSDALDGAADVFGEDFDLDAIATGYRADLAALLPQGWTIAGDEVYREVDAQDIADLDELREAAGDIEIDWTRHQKS
jgi:hypothetical protein